MGITAEKVAGQWKVSREAQDEFATESHRRALAAIEKGEFKQEITPYTLNEHVPDFEHHQVVTRSKVVAVDEGPRAGTTREVLAKLRPAFAANGSVTAGNSSQTSAAAGAVILPSQAAFNRFNFHPPPRLPVSPLPRRPPA